MRILFMALSILFLTSCGSPDTTTTGTISPKPELQSVDELNETVWEDSKEAFDILIKQYEENSTVTKDETKRLDSYFEKYYESGYKDNENAESYLVTSIKALDVNINLQGVGNEESQKERLQSIQESYMSLDQKFKEH